MPRGNMQVRFDAEPWNPYQFRRALRHLEPNIAACTAEWLSLQKEGIIMIDG